MESLTTTNVWLGILAIVSLLEFLMIVAAGFFAYQMYKQVMATIETVERVQSRHCARGSTAFSMRCRRSPTR